MDADAPPKDRVLELGKLTPEDLRRIRQCRRNYNRLGFGYQVAFVRLENRFPIQMPFELIDDVLTFVAVQTNIAACEIQEYADRQQTISEHQAQIRDYLSLAPFENAERAKLEAFLFDECCRLEQTAILRLRAREHLRNAGILEPGRSILDRLIGEQRRRAREHIFTRVHGSLDADHRQRLDALLEVGDKRNSALRIVKESAGSPSASAMLRLTGKLDRIRETGVLDLDLAWLNNNFQRALAKHAKKCSAHRLKHLSAPHRYASLVCFLVQTYQDTIDFVVDMQDKLLLRICSQAEREVDEALARKRKSIQRSASMLQKLGKVLLDDEVPEEEIRTAVFEQVPRDELAAQVAESVDLAGDKAEQEFKRVMRRFSYLRRYTPAVLEHLAFESQTNEHPSPVLDAVASLVAANESHARKLPPDTPVDFVPKRLRGVVGENGSRNRQAWECSLLIALRDEIKFGNLAVGDSKRFGNFDRFFVESDEWENHRSDFFCQAGLPCSANDAIDYLADRLGRAFDEFLQAQPENAFASIDEDGWRLSTDAAEKLSADDEQKLIRLKEWLAKNMRPTRLPDLLIEVDNELQFTRHFTRDGGENREVEEICTVLATVLAHGCNIGPYTMAKLTDGVSYSQIKRVTDWQLSEDNQRSALADVVRAISSLGTSLTWGEGKASSSDGQRFLFPQKVLQRTFSHRMSDYALEFYSFVADNYAPFYSTPIECSDRDAAYVLDGLLYNESDLDLEEHYTDTHGYTEINFAAFAMLGKRFCPRIRGVQHQRMYRIDKDRDYGCLEPLVSRSDRTINLKLIRDHWDRMGHFYASLESGHATASVALKRLAGYSRKNLFCRANRELGRVFKTEFILHYMSQSPLRRRIRRGLLKGEQLHALARDVCYGKRGRITARDLQEQMNTCSCLTLILASIIFWQAREIERVIAECDPLGAGIELSLLEHVSPIEWENVLLYGEYVIDRDRIQVA
jgi:TnpA family transposase